MKRTVGQWMTRNVVSTRPDAPLFEGVERMAEELIRHVLVLEDGRLRGILSNRDIVRAALFHADKHIDLHGTSVGQVMTGTPLVTTTPEASLAQAAGLMREQHVNALPVLDAEGAVVGILTSEDVLGAVASSEMKARRPDA